MIDVQNTPQRVWHYTAEVQEGGVISLKLPLPHGTKVTVFVISDSEAKFIDLLQAAESSLDFWDNAFDDEGWKNRYKAIFS